MQQPLVALVLAGGVGTRLYPASRSHRPKQFLRFGGDGSLLARTVDRVGFVDEVYVSTRPAFADQVRDHAPRAGVIVEPVARDTGPAIVHAATRIREQVGECVVLALPSDHLVEGSFAEAAHRGARVAVETEGVVTFGIEPTRPATEYGYIRPGTDYSGYFDVDEFVEKPAESRAREFVDRGFYWNAGMFAFTPATLLRCARNSPLAPLVDALSAGEPERGFDAVDTVSVDRAIMERTDDAYVVPAALEWDDLGSWDALRRVGELDDGGNAVLGEGLLLDASGNVVASDGAHVSVVGVSDLVVAAYDDRVLVVPVEQAQRVREVVDTLQSDGRF